MCKLLFARLFDYHLTHQSKSILLLKIIWLFNTLNFHAQKALFSGKVDQKDAAAVKHLAWWLTTALLFAWGLGPGKPSEQASLSHQEMLLQGTKPAIFQRSIKNLQIINLCNKSLFLPQFMSRNLEKTTKLSTRAKHFWEFCSASVYKGRFQKKSLNQNWSSSCQHWSLLVHDFQTKHFRFSCKLWLWSIQNHARHSLQAFALLGSAIWSRLFNLNLSRLPFSWTGCCFRLGSDLLLCTGFDLEHAVLFPCQKANKCSKARVKQWAGCCFGHTSSHQFHWKFHLTWKKKQLAAAQN